MFYVLGYEPQNWGSFPEEVYRLSFVTAFRPGLGPSVFYMVYVKTQSVSQTV